MPGISKSICLSVLVSRAFCEGDATSRSMEPLRRAFSHSMRDAHCRGARRGRLSQPPQCADAVDGASDSRVPQHPSRPDPGTSEHRPGARRHTRGSAPHAAGRPAGHGCRRTDDTPAAPNCTASVGYWRSLVHDEHGGQRGRTTKSKDRSDILAPPNTVVMIEGCSPDPLASAMGDLLRELDVERASPAIGLYRLEYTRLKTDHAPG